MYEIPDLKHNKPKRFAGEMGKEYELIKLVCPHFEELEKTVMTTIQKYFQKSNQKEISILEVGCGPGYTTEMISLADPRVKIIAIDNETAMIQQAKEVLHDLIENGTLKLEQADSLEYLKKLPPESMDCFASGFTLHNFPKKYRSAFLKEVFRVLKKNGLFVNADMYSYDDPKEQTAHREWKLEKFKTAFSQIGRDDLAIAWSKHHLEDENPKVIMREKEAIREMEKNGFRDIQTIYRNHLEATLTATKPT